MTIWWSLGLLWLATSPAGAGSAPQEAPRHQEVKGYGPTHAIAKQDALREAGQQLAKHLAKIEPPLTHWTPSESFVRDHLEGGGRADQDAVFEKIGPMKTWVVTLKVPADAELITLDRQAQREARAEQRLSQALHVVAALFVMLLVGVGYVRLDDWTRSRYTPWLRVAGAAVLALAAAGWWWSV